MSGVSLGRVYSQITKGNSSVTHTSNNNAEFLHCVLFEDIRDYKKKCKSLTLSSTKLPEGCRCPACICFNGAHTLLQNTLQKFSLHKIHLSVKLYLHTID